MRKLNVMPQRLTDYRQFFSPYNYRARDARKSFIKHRKVAKIPCTFLN